MVAAAMKPARLMWGAAAIAAFGYLAAMVVTGALPEQRQLVKFEAAGVMASLPERITRVELVRGGKSAVLVRSGDAGWISETKGPLPKPLAEKVSMAVQFMNTAKPVRALEAAEYRGTDPREFGIDKPRMSVTLSDASAPVLRAHFGGLTPDGFAQYMAVDRRDELFLMSLFVGQYWSEVADGTLAK